MNYGNDPADEARGLIRAEEDRLAELRDGAQARGQKCPNCGSATATTKEGGEVSCSSCGYEAKE